MIEEGSKSRSPVGIIHGATDPGLVKHIDPVAGHGRERLVKKGT
jgi:hypothetical protein